MKIFTQQLILISAVFIGSSLVTAYHLVGDPRNKAIAIVPDRSMTVQQSIPSLPGKLALNPSQKDNILKINLTFNRSIYQILTVKQLQQFSLAMSDGLPLFPALNTLSLTCEQEKKIWLALGMAQGQIQGVLTPEQLEYVKRKQEEQGTGGDKVVPLDRT
jgi:hypothetical protein